MASKCTKDAGNVYAPLVMVSIGAGKGHLKEGQFIKMDRKKPILPPSVFIRYKSPI
jgi:hypothetical protein